MDSKELAVNRVQEGDVLRPQPTHHKSSYIIPSPETEVPSAESREITFQPAVQPVRLDRLYLTAPVGIQIRNVRFNGRDVIADREIPAEVLTTEGFSDMLEPAFGSIKIEFVNASPAPRTISVGLAVVHE